MFVLGFFLVFLICFVGYAAVSFFVGRGLSPFILALSFLTGVLLNSWITFLGSLLFFKTEYPLFYGNLIFFIFSFLVFLVWRRKNTAIQKENLFYSIFPFSLSKKTFLLTFFWTVLLCFFLFLMYHSFSYDSAKGVFYIGVKSWSDFASHMATIRSFSLGHNFPPQSPLYAGEFFRYHFLLWFFVANLEFVGLSLHHALNIFSAISMLALVLAIYNLTKFLIKQESVATIAVILFLMNGSLAFFRLLDWNPVVAWKNISDHVASNLFLSSGLPFRGEDWGLYSLNIYTNQRHFPFAMAVFASLVILLIKSAAGHKLRDKRIFIYMGIMIGLMPFAESFTFLALIMVFCLFFLFSKQKSALIPVGLIAFLLAAPQLYFLKDPQGKYPMLNPGYTFSATLENFLLFLGIIFGAKFLFFLIGFVLSNREVKKMAFLTIPVLIFPFIVRLGPEEIHGHKFFNLWLVIACPIIACGVFYVFQKVRRLAIKIPVITIVLLILAGTGILDTIAVTKDAAMTFFEKNDPLFNFVKNQTAKSSVFLTNEYFHSPIVYAGRKLLLGNGYVPWSFGYNATERMENIRAMFTAQNKEQFCKLAGKFSLNYVMLDANTKYGLDDKEFFDKWFPLVFQREDPMQFVYNINDCRKIVFDYDTMYNGQILPRKN